MGKWLCRLIGRDEDFRKWRQHQRDLRARALGWLDIAAPLASGLPKDRAGKYRSLVECIPWGVPGSEPGKWMCDAPRLIRALVSIPAELSAVVALDRTFKPRGLVEVAMQALTQRPALRAQAGEQLGWSSEQLTEKVAAIVACAVCSSKTPEIARELFASVTDTDVRVATETALARDHEAVAEMILRR